jgi:hypothetical protein
VELLARIFADTGNVNAVYNQARCYQANGRPERALARFREYLRLAADIAPRERERVKGFMRELEQQLAERPAPQPAATPPAVFRAPIALEASAGAPTPLPAPTEPPADDGHRSDAIRTIRKWQIAAGGVAAASLLPVAVGVYYAQKAAGIRRQIEQQTEPITYVELEARWRHGERAAARRGAAWLVAGGMLAGAGVLYLLGRPAGNRATTSVTFDPLIGRGAGGAVIAGTF